MIFLSFIVSCTVKYVRWIPPLEPRKLTLFAKLGTIQLVLKKTPGANKRVIEPIHDASTNYYECDKVIWRPASLSNSIILALGNYFIFLSWAAFDVQTISSGLWKHFNQHLLLNTMYATNSLSLRLNLFVGSHNSYLDYR